MKPQCKLKPNHQVMRTLMISDCVYWKNIDIVDLASNCKMDINLAYGIRMILYKRDELSYCQRCVNYIGDYPRVPKGYENETTMQT